MGNFDNWQNGSIENNEQESFSPVVTPVPVSYRNTKDSPSAENFDTKPQTTQQTFDFSPVGESFSSSESFSEPLGFQQPSKVSSMEERLMSALTLGQGSVHHSEAEKVALLKVQTPLNTGVENFQLPRIDEFENVSPAQVQPSASVSLEPVSKKKLLLKKIFNLKTVIAASAILVLTLGCFAVFLIKGNVDEKNRKKIRDFDLTIYELVEKMNEAKKDLPKEYMREDDLNPLSFIYDQKTKEAVSPNGITYIQYIATLKDGHIMAVKVNKETSKVMAITIKVKDTEYKKLYKTLFGLQAEAAIATDSSMTFKKYQAVMEKLHKDIEDEKKESTVNKGRNAYSQIKYTGSQALQVYAGKSYLTYKGYKDVEPIGVLEQLLNITTTEPTTKADPLKSDNKTEESSYEGKAITFADALQINSDVVAWLGVSGTNITGPVLQSSDNNYYLTRTIYKKYSRFGSRYADFRCNVKEGEQSQNITIYGHYSDEGIIFAKVHNYMDIDFFKAHSVIELSTPTEVGNYKVFAVFITNTMSQHGAIFEYRDPEFVNQESFLYFIERVKRRTIVNTDVDIKENDKIITLSTCNRKFKEARLVVMARKVRPGEAPSQDLSKISYNANPLYPPVWYTSVDKKATKPSYPDEP